MIYITIRVTLIKEHQPSQKITITRYQLINGDGFTVQELIILHIEVIQLCTIDTVFVYLNIFTSLGMLANMKMYFLVEKTTH